LKSEGDARKFMKKFNGKTMEKNGEEKLKIRMMTGYEGMRRHQKSEWLKITNLHCQVSEKQLTDHIQEKSKKEPRSLEIRPHFKKSGYPSFALVRMKSLKDAETVIKKLRMTQLNKQKIWVRKCDGIDQRNREVKAKKKQKAKTTKLSRKVKAKKKVKGSSFSGKKKMGKSKNRLAAAKAKGDRKKGKKWGVKK